MTYSEEQRGGESIYTKTEKRRKETREQGRVGGGSVEKRRLR